MKRTVLAGSFASLLMLGLVSQAWCAQVVGVVKDAAGKLVQGVKIEAIDESGKVAGQALSGVNGTYVIDGLQPGKYVFKLDPEKTGMQAGNGVAYLDANGLTVDWTVSPDAVALDDATPLAPGLWSSVSGWALTPVGIQLGAGAVIGGTLGGLGAAGGLGGGGGGGTTTTPAL